jgi:hypothetical protein
MGRANRYRPEPGLLSILVSFRADDIVTPLQFAVSSEDTRKATNTAKVIAERILFHIMSMTAVYLRLFTIIEHDRPVC